jgi:CheY-like chemotaxis protein/HPt (histidine-containing phosphotransfer) domain-containing protein
MHYGAAESGAEALAFLQYKSTRGTPYDLVILDSQLPDMDALTLARDIKSRVGITALRLVVLSAMAQTEDAEALQQAGIQAILTKPFRQSRLYDCLATVMGGSLEEQAALRRTASPPVEVRTLGHGRILLAEDNPVNQEVALGMLEALGCHADLASNGREVLEALEQKTYDLILMDCQMPEMDGFEATKHIREMEARNKGQQGSALTVRSSNFAPRISNFGQFSHLPIIAVTAHAITGDRERCITAGMDDYLSKPFVQDQLQAVLLRWMPPRPGESALNGAHQTVKPAVNESSVPVAAHTHHTNGSAVPRSSHETLSSVSSHPSNGNGAAAYLGAPTIDTRAWDSIRSLQRPGQPDMLCKVIDKYLSSSRQLIETMRTAVSQRDAGVLHRTAHSLKSSSATLGALRLAALCKEVEAMGRTNALDGVASLWENIEAEYALVQEALTAELNQVKP